MRSLIKVFWYKHVQIFVSLHRFFLFLSYFTWYKNANLQKEPNSEQKKGKK